MHNISPAMKRTKWLGNARLATKALIRPNPFSVSPKHVPAQRSEWYVTRYGGSTVWVRGRRLNEDHRGVLMVIIQLAKPHGTARFAVTLVDIAKGMGKSNPYDRKVLRQPALGP